MILIKDVACKSICNKLNQGEVIFSSKEKFKEIDVLRHPGEIVEEEYISYTSTYDKSSYVVQKYWDKKGRKSEFYSISQIRQDNIRLVFSLKDLLLEMQ